VRVLVFSLLGQPLFISPSNTTNYSLQRGEVVILATLSKNALISSLLHRLCREMSEFISQLRRLKS
ncbi:MAG TPA: hypothetical protein VFK30_00210, partial [Anaerolineae bacterium]|nr:hypothetical protein [Anaerolineae bacterium]